MDVFVEQLVKKKKSAGQILAIVGARGASFVSAVDPSYRLGTWLCRVYHRGHLLRRVVSVDRAEHRV